MLSKFLQSQCALAAVDIHEIPEVDEDGQANGNEGEEADVFDGDDAAEGDASDQKPLPPFPTKWNVSKLIEFNVGVNRCSHEKDQRGIEKNEASLTNMGVIEQKKT